MFEFDPEKVPENLRHKSGLVLGRGEFAVTQTFPERIPGRAEDHTVLFASLEAAERFFESAVGYHRATVVRLARVNHAPFERHGLTVLEVLREAEGVGNAPVGR